MNPTNLSQAKRGAESLFHRYRPPGGVYDEMFGHDGSLREHWHEFADLADALGPQELRRRWEQASRLIHEDGVTYNVHGDQGRDRRWELDALPLLIRVIWLMNECVSSCLTVRESSALTEVMPWMGIRSLPSLSAPWLPRFK